MYLDAGYNITMIRIAIITHSTKPPVIEVTINNQTQTMSIIETRKMALALLQSAEKAKLLDTIDSYLNLTLEESEVNNICHNIARITDDTEI